MNTAILLRMQADLDKKAAQDQLRSLTLRQGLTDFCSNDYLGLAKDPAFQAQVSHAWAAMAQPLTGATGSRLISGNSAYAIELEADLAVRFQAESCLLFGSGFQANSALLSTLPRRGDTILCDELAHASMKEGCRLSFADTFSFRHNDAEDLDKKLGKARGHKFVLVESVYSMDGDEADWEALSAVCRRHDAALLVDEAHSTGSYGPGGAGWCCQQGIADQVLARVMTFGKAIGGHGACITGPKVLTDYLINHARSFIYTTAMPLHSLVVIREAFHFIDRHPERQTQLRQRIEWFKTAATACQLDTKSNSAIQYLPVPGNTACRQAAQYLQSVGFDVRPIRSPTVPSGHERLRICLHSFDQQSDIQSLLNHFAQWQNHS